MSPESRRAPQDDRVWVAPMSTATAQNASMEEETGEWMDPANRGAAGSPSTDESSSSGGSGPEGSWSGMVDVGDDDDDDVDDTVPPLSRRPEALPLVSPVVVSPEDGDDDTDRGGEARAGDQCDEATTGWNRSLWLGGSSQLASGAPFLFPSSPSATATPPSPTHDVCLLVALLSPIGPPRHAAIRARTLGDALAACRRVEPFVLEIDLGAAVEGRGPHSTDAVLAELGLVDGDLVCARVSAPAHFEAVAPELAEHARSHAESTLHRAMVYNGGVLRELLRSTPTALDKCENALESESVQRDLREAQRAHFEAERAALVVAESALVAAESLRGRLQQALHAAEGRRHRGGGGRLGPLVPEPVVWPAPAQDQPPPVQQPPIPPVGAAPQPARARAEARGAAAAIVLFVPDMRLIVQLGLVCYLIGNDDNFRMLCALCVGYYLYAAGMIPRALARRLTLDGVARVPPPQARGFALDARILISTFLMSLIPAWRVRAAVVEPQQPARA